MVIKAVIEISLVDECSEKTNTEIASEIFNDLTKGKIIIPWCKQVDKVVVLDSSKLY